YQSELSSSGLAQMLEQFAGALYSDGAANLEAIDKRELLGKLEHIQQSLNAKTPGEQQALPPLYPV
ncbi:MAG: hypothetical protein OIF35_00105, partial [Cellvibrionaceae bacterium]|nr:hypothetical protein [Cellvibrionaceae bacterium]